MSTVAFWVDRARDQRLDRVEFADRKPGRAWNRTGAELEQHVLALRHTLRERSVLGEYGPDAIRTALESTGMAERLPSRATIHRVLTRHGALDGVRRIRRPAPPKGWYLPAVTAGEAELDCFDFIEDLKIAGGPLTSVLTAKSLHGGLADAWILERRSAQVTLERLIERWRHDGLPGYAQFDNDTLFQGAHQFPDSVGRVSRLCLALGVVPVFVPPLEHGMQNLIEGFNALWQAKLWQRHRVTSLGELERLSDHYIAAHRARSRCRIESAPPRTPFPKRFRLDLNAPLRGKMIFLRRTDERGRAHLLGRSFPVRQDWQHRLVRCEVDFCAHIIRFHALRRRDPLAQPLLATTAYHRPDKPFQGTP